MPQLNDYNTIADTYNLTHTKPDKLYSILPTVLNICKDSTNPQTILDLGCGNGFFTSVLAQTYPHAQVIGIDNSQKQIERAEEIQKDLALPNIKFILGDINNLELPAADLIVAPFIFGYLNDAQLDIVLKRIFAALNPGGSLIMVLDNPQGIDNSRYGARKTLNQDGSMRIELFDQKGMYLTTLNALYHDIHKAKQNLIDIGFNHLQEAEPIISTDGYTSLGQDFWRDYTKNSELVYLSCKK